MGRQTPSASGQEFDMATHWHLICLFLLLLYALRQAIDGHEEELGFSLYIHVLYIITDLDFADDIAIYSDSKV